MQPRGRSSPLSFFQPFPKNTLTSTSELGRHSWTTDILTRPPGTSEPRTLLRNVPAQRVSWVWLVAGWLLLTSTQHYLIPHRKCVAPPSKHLASSAIRRPLLR